MLERGSLQYRDKRRGKVLGSSTCGAHQTELEETKRGLLARRLLAAGGASARRMPAVDHMHQRDARTSLVAAAVDSAAPLRLLPARCCR